MRNSLAGQLGALIVAASLMTSTSIAGVPQAQQQSAQQPSSQTSSQPQTGTQQGNTAPSQQHYCDTFERYTFQRNGCTRQRAFCHDTFWHGATGICSGG